MIKVTIELYSAKSGIKSHLGEMHIMNTGDHPNHPDRADYNVRVFRKGSARTQRSGHVADYPRLSYSIWRLVSRAIRSAFPEEK